jgi:ferredoxin-NADP reductase
MNRSAPVAALAAAVFRDELDQLSTERGVRLHYVVGDHRDASHAHLLTAAHLGELVPDLHRDVFLCGPPASSW